jgi:oxalate decarboxylase/phosphoglucose isomerase-like protein (cupin superfamily)
MARPFRNIHSSMRESHLAEFSPPFVDQRGEILNLLDLPIGSVSMITSVKGAVRANHYHKTDWHYCVMQKGSMDYYFRPVGDKNPAKYIRVEEGRMIYTPSNEEHAMVFTSDAIMWCFAGNPRTSADYEADTVRVPSLVPSSPAV